MTEDGRTDRSSSKELGSMRKGERGERREESGHTVPGISSPQPFRKYVIFSLFRGGRVDQVLVWVGGQGKRQGWTGGVGE